MEKLYRKVPFDIETAKKIMNNEVDGVITTTLGCRARILAFDFKSRDELCIVTAERMGDSCETIGFYDKRGIAYSSAWRLEISISDRKPEGDGCLEEMPDRRKKFEYFVKVITKFNLGTLQEFGNKGWELVSINELADKHIALYFKREVI